jgi:hypothetical protein
VWRPLVPTVTDLPLRCRAGRTLLLAACVVAPVIAGAQAAQAVRVGRDTGVGTGATEGGMPTAGQSDLAHRYGPPESVRRRDAQLEASVPAQYAPPAGMCRLWVRGVPADRQPAPTECAKAVRVRSPNSQIVFGKSKPAGGTTVGVPVAGGWVGGGGGAGGGSSAEPLLGNRGGFSAEPGAPALGGGPAPKGPTGMVAAPGGSVGGNPGGSVGATPPHVSEAAPASPQRITSRSSSHQHPAPPPHPTARSRR